MRSVYRSNPLTSRESILPSNIQVVILMAHRTLAWARSRAIAALAPRRARAHAHLPTLFQGRVVAAVGGVGCGAVELVLDEAVVAVGAVGHDGGFVDDAGPDGGEGEEDACDGEGLGAEFGDGVFELKNGEDRWGVLVVVARR